MRLGRRRVDKNSRNLFPVPPHPTERSQDPLPPPRHPQGYFYYIFGFAFLVAVLTIIITIEVSIVCTYVQVGWGVWEGGVPDARDRLQRTSRPGPLAAGPLSAVRFHMCCTVCPCSCARSGDLSTHAPCRPSARRGALSVALSGCPLTPSPTLRSCVLRTTCGGGAPTTAAAPSPSTCSSTPWASWSTRCTSEGARTWARAPLLPQQRQGRVMVEPACSSVEAPTQCLTRWGARRGLESRVTLGERCPAPWAHATTGCCPRLSLCAHHPPVLRCAYGSPQRPALPHPVPSAALHRRSLTGFIPVVLYVSYMSLMVWCLFLAMGTIGFLSSFIFTYAIFNASKSVSGGGRRRTRCRAQQARA